MYRITASPTKPMKTLQAYKIPGVTVSDQISQSDNSIAYHDAVNRLDFEDKSFQEKQTRLTILIISLWTVVQLITFAKNLFIYNLLSEPIDYASQFTKRAIPWATAIVFIFIINYSSKYLLKTRVTLLQLPFVHFMIATLISVIMYVSSFYAISIMGTTAFETSNVIKYFMVEIDRLFLVYLLISITTTAHHYFHQLRTRELAFQQMESAYRETKILSLNNEVNPHMLFNVLNNIYTVVDDDIQHAKNMILDFSELLRENLRNNGSIYITLSHEKAFLKNFVNLQNGGSKNYKLQFIENNSLLNDALLPKMVLQPLIENAIKHTALDHNKPLVIVVESKLTNGRFSICVRNHLSSHETESHASSNIGIGTKNILKRLEVLYPNDFEFRIKKDNENFSCLINIPFRQEQFALAEN